MLKNGTRLRRLRSLEEQYQAMETKPLDGLSGTQAPISISSALLPLLAVSTPSPHFPSAYGK